MADEKNENGSNEFVENQDEEADISAQSDARAKEFQDDISQQMNMHFSRLENDVRDVYNQRMETIESNLVSQLTDRVLNAQSDILKTNKVFREICRPLGYKWKEMYTILTAGLPQDEVESELVSIEKQGSLMQPYKSLMSWKDLKGASFNVEELIPVFKNMGLNELAEKVDKILYHDTKDELFDLSCIGKSPDSVEGAKRKATPSRSRTTESPKSSTTPPPAGSARASCGASTSVATAGVSENASKIPPSASSAAPASPENPEEAIDDRHLLFLAKKVVEVWDKLAKALNVPEEDVSDILTSEGTLNYQGAFRMLWMWRESRSGSGEAANSVELLTSALTQIGKSDLIGMLRS